MGPGTTTAKVMFRGSVGGHILVPWVLVPVSQQMGRELRLRSCWCWIQPWGRQWGTPLPINTTIAKYNRTSSMSIPCTMVDSQGSFQPHNQLLCNITSCPMGLASFCPCTVGRRGEGSSLRHSGGKATPGHPGVLRHPHAVWHWVWLRPGPSRDPQILQEGCELRTGWWREGGAWGQVGAETAGWEQGRQRGRGSRKQQGRGREAGKKVACSPPALAYCQPYVPAASLAADVSQCLPLPRCQVSQQTLPVHAVHAHPALGMSW